MCCTFIYFPAPKLHPAKHLKTHDSWRKFANFCPTLAKIREFLHLTSMYSRILDLGKILKHRSLFLFGPRRTGKSTYLRDRFPEARYYDLLDSKVFRELSAAPELLRERLRPEDSLIIIDEVQKLPALLDEVQLLIERQKNLRFILTGSSLRKLRRGQANLLAGRAITAHFFPLVHAEVPDVPLERRLLRGNLPAIIDSEIPEEDLKAYVGDYLKEEIQAEFESRKLEGFSRFLNFAATCSGEQINYSALGSELGINPKIIREYFQALDDTLVGSELPAFTGGKLRKPVTSSKFYFFDIGVSNILLNRSLQIISNDMLGSALEHLIFHELRAYLSYNRLNHKLNYWRSYSQLEVDFLLSEEVAIEVKATSKVTKKDKRGLLALEDEVLLRRKIIVCRESEPRKDENGIEIIPVNLFLEQLWKGKIVT